MRKQIVNSSEYSFVMRSLGAPQKGDTNNHPKLLHLKELLLSHFAAIAAESAAALANQDDDSKAAAATKEASSKVMVFSQWRDSVEEIEAMLLQHQPIIRPMAFTGQARANSYVSSRLVSSRALLLLLLTGSIVVVLAVDSKAGISKKEQKLILERFKAGDFNTLVCTSIGEEGIDIGEVDLIVCFDVQDSAIRSVQRRGRTGRRKDGTCSTSSFAHLDPPLPRS